MIETTEYPRSNFIARQILERETLEKMYSVMPVGAQQRAYGSAKLIAALGSDLSVGQVGTIAKNLESAGILKRELEFGAKVDGVYLPGRSTHWTLLVPKEEAMNLLDLFHREAQSTTSHTKNSLKNRVLWAIEEEGSFSSANDILNRIKKPGENIDLHSLTHILHSLKGDGKISFRKDDKGQGGDIRKANNAIPVDIKLTKAAIKQKEVSAIVDDPEPTVFIPEAQTFDLIVRLVNRRQALEQASKLAEGAGEEDVAIELLQRADKTLTTFESEVIRLWEAYNTCRES